MAVREDIPQEVEQSHPKTRLPITVKVVCATSIFADLILLLTELAWW